MFSTVVVKHVSAIRKELHYVKLITIFPTTLLNV